VLGDQIYIAALLELAGKMLVGKTLVLDRSKVITDLAITDTDFDDIQRQLEARIPGKWNRASDTAGQLYVYMRLA
jgi:hypothetical protein